MIMLKCPKCDWAGPDLGAKQGKNEFGGLTYQCPKCGTVSDAFKLSQAYYDAPRPLECPFSHLQFDAAEWEAHDGREHPEKECPYCDFKGRGQEYERHVAKEVLKYGPKTSLVIDFTWLRDYLDKGGIILTTVKCPQCGAALELPKTGTATKCQYCGSGIYALDLLEKLKGVLKQ